MAPAPDGTGDGTVIDQCFKPPREEWGWMMCECRLRNLFRNRWSGWGGMGVILKKDLHILRTLYQRPLRATSDKLLLFAVSRH